MIHVYQGVTSREIDDTVEKVKLNNDLEKRKILTWLGYGALIAFVIWFVTGSEQIKIFLMLPSKNTDIFTITF
jgi:type IV secretory pathway component VirB8